MPSRKKILISAYACEPNKGSEPDVGWNWSLQLVRFHDVTVLTRANNRAAIEAELARLRGSGPLPNFIYHDLGPVALNLKRVFKSPRLYYIFWQRSAQSVIAEAHQEQTFDLIHHLTFATFRYRTAIWGHGTPTIWGPVGGAESIPWRLLPWRYPASLLPEMVRNLNNLLHLTTLGIIRKRALDSSCVLANTLNMQQSFADMGIHAELMPSIGMHTSVVPSRQVSPPAGPLRLLFVGSLVSLKGVDLAIEALNASGSNARLTLVGEGPFRSTLERLARGLNLSGRVEFRGRVSRAEVMALYPQFDVLLFPSLHDTGGYAVVEAMLNQLPVICLEVGGPQVAVRRGTGVRVPLGSRSAVVRGLATAIQVYDRERQRIVEDGATARSSVIQNYDWQRKGDRMAAIYDWLLLHSKPRRLKVLLSAYACEPNKGSEPGVGWRWALQMAHFHDVWVLTRANNRPTIEQARLTPEQQRHLHWVYFDLAPWARFWKQGSRGVQLYYYLWQLAAWRRGARLHREIVFDLLHHVTFGKYWMPSFLAFLPIKSILGPLGGGESTPPALTGKISWQGQKFELARNLARRLAQLDLPARAIMRRANVVLATTEETKKRIERLGASRVVVEAQWAMDDEQLEFFARFRLRTEKPFRLISIGRLLHWKGFHLGLQAFARFHRLCPESEYWIVSGGPEAGAWKRLAQDLGIASRVTFWGYLPKLTDVYEKLAQADVLVHPALHEAFGNVCLEALAAGRPVICLDTGGPGLQVTAACGFKAPVASFEEALQSMADSMTRLYRNPDLRLRMAAAARQRVRSHFHWRQKAEQMNTLYHEVCRTGAARNNW